MCCPRVDIYGVAWWARVDHWGMELLNLIFPRQCAGCGAWDESLCERCCAEFRHPWRDVTASSPRLVTVQPGIGEPVLVPILPVLAMAAYEGRVRDTIIRWKNGQADLERPLCAEVTAAVSRLRAMGDRSIAEIAGEDLDVVPLPSRRKRYRDGRFVAGALADAVARGLCERGTGGAVVRSVDLFAPLGSSQSGRGLRGRQRQSMAVRADLPRRRIVLVDDVVTTGATLAAGARALRSQGHDVLGALVVAAALNPRRSTPGAGGDEA